MARSVTSETKAKFEALLKAALKKGDSKSTQNLIEQTQELGNDNKGIESTAIEEHQQAHYILDTFLKEDSQVVVEKPVPRVRTKLLQQRSSDSEKGSIQSNQTFTVEKNNNRKDVQIELSKGICDASRSSSSSSKSSRRTYNVDKEEIGDIVVHGRKETVQILKVSTNRGRSSISNTEDGGIELQELRSKETYSEAEKSDRDDEKTTIVYEDEVKNRNVKTKKQKKGGTREIQQSDQVSDKIVSIAIHKTDRLKLNKFIVHPMVKIHIVNYETGEYIKKTNPEKPGILYLENANINYLMPVMTENFNLQQQRKFYPEWEETIIINESYQFIMEETTKTMLLFELKDFVNFNTISSQGGASDGWHDIAWAFLKIVAGDGSTNTNRKLRLQLYKPGQLKKGSCCLVYDWWKQKRNKYPSTLYVTVKGIPSPQTIVETFRSKTPLEKEVGCDFNDGEELKTIQVELKAEEKQKVQDVLTNLQEKTLKLPNKLHAELDSGDEGCFALKFGNTGKYLACAILSKEVYSLVVYLSPDLEEFFKLSSHQGLIYNIAFSNDDSLIAASSADGTVSIWDLNKVKFLQILPHPSFVYWCEISADFIITACYDKTLRVWRLSKNLTWELFEELEEHEGYITSLCINSSQSCIYSSDSKGIIICWKRNNEAFNLHKKIVLVELKNTIINQIILHKKEKRLLVHARDSILRILDIKNECIIHWLEGGINYRVRTICCLSHCNNYVFCGSGSGYINVWNMETGKMTATYNPYTKLSVKDLPIHTLDFCRKSKMLAFSHFGHKIPITVYIFNPITTDVDVKTFDAQKKWKSVTENVAHKARNKRSAATNGTEERNVNLKEILDKIDKIIA